MQIFYLLKIYIEYNKDINKKNMLSKKLTKSLLRTTDNYIKALEKAGILTV